MITDEDNNSWLYCYIKLLRAAESVSSRATTGLREAGLTISQFGVLEALLHKGPLTLTELAQKILRTSGNLTMVVDNLEKQKLVERRRSQEDRRAVTVHLTSLGRRRIEKLLPGHLDQVRQEMGVLSQAEQQQLSRLCRKLGLKEA